MAPLFVSASWSHTDRASANESLITSSNHFVISELVIAAPADLFGSGCSESHVFRSKVMRLLKLARIFSDNTSKKPKHPEISNSKTED